MGKKSLLALLVSAATILSVCGSAWGSARTSTADAAEQPATVTLFAAKSLNSVMEELIPQYEKAHPGIKIVGSYDSSGTLMQQIEEGAACDLFFSAAQKQMNELEEKGFVVEGTRADVVNNQVCVVTYKDSGTQVTGLSDIAKAANLALADGSVPVGKYTRQALINADLMPDYVAAKEKEGVEKKDIDASLITTEEVSDALGGIEINECANVGAVTAAVAEGSNEVGTVYRSDLCGHEKELEILEIVPYELTGNVIYPVAQIVNPEAEEAEAAAAKAFAEYLVSDEAKAVFEKYLFDTNI